ncbi:peptidoglycan-binding protein [Aeromicrobium sp. 50.2.37]|uniref:peptidoglycan-binding domain-containing protein n=1 Tax=Aeromicrobium sp. 50.2.37 TaxID=2969305 RepID=UPI00214FBC6C|nr:peptidoglycan-binding protein [Aeromicrobium sp. 50.2.37]MCR4514387.1 peptidoglycan-binding protein [Aeromicrobium sp. 50.2.37]
MRRLGLACAAALMCAATLTAVGGTSSAAQAATQTTPLPLPAKPKGLKAPVALPAAVDPPSAYVPQVACQPGTPAGVAKTRDLVMRTYGVGGKGNTARGCSEGVSEHADGRAWDWMVDVKDAKEKKAAADFLAWLTKDGGTNARRLGIMYVIYNERIWAVYRSKEGWRKSSGHRDHVHLSFSWNGARGTTSFWTGKVHPVDHGPCSRFAGQPAVMNSKARTTRCYAAVPLVKRTSWATIALGSRAGTVKTAQKALGVKQTGTFDAATREAVKTYQKKHDLPWTGTLDQPTWASLVPAKVTSDVAKGLSAAEAAAYGAKHYSSSMPERTTGKAVLVLQVALGMKRADRNGYYGPLTVAAVRARQKAMGRSQTGTWTKGDWAALAP